MKIYDVFMFFNELDLLELRLNILDEFVDYFVISECDYTFSGIKKPFNFEKNEDRFNKFKDKIIYIKHFDSGKIKLEKNDNITYNKIVDKFNSINANWKKYGHWCRDWLHREFCKLGIDKCDDDDYIIFSDLDEIPNPKYLMEVLPNDEIYRCKQDLYYYNINNLIDIDWFGTIITKYKNIKSISMEELRNHKNISIIQNGGWHFSFFGGKEKIIEKIESYSHQELNTEDNKKNIEQSILENKVFFDSAYTSKEVKLSEKLHPKYLVDNINKYKIFLKNK